MTQYRPIHYLNLRLDSPFWRERLDTLSDRTIMSQHEKLDEYGTLESLKLPQPPPPLRFPRHANGFTVQVFWDADVGKWIEAAAYSLHHKRDPKIEAMVDAAVDDFARAQAADGYLDCWYLGHEPEKRWSNLRDNHELLNAGHMLEGAIAYYEVTGKRKWLDVMERYLDLIRELFGPNPGQKRGYDGHEEIELALIKLYRLTGDPRHLEMAKFFVDVRGQQPHFFDIELQERLAKNGETQLFVQNYEYSQSHVPVREQKRVVGHAVRAMHLYTAMADLALETGDADLKTACEALWADLVGTKLYVTGGIGPSAQNEGFTSGYDLPNQSAYAETCASIGVVLWASRMLHLDMKVEYADIMELALFNGALAGLSRSGDHYFYTNPLESDGSVTRWDWHSCPCCTTNIARLIGSVAEYFMSSSDDGIAFHMYGGTRTTLNLAGTRVSVVEISNYPWSGDISIAVNPESEVAFELRARVPGWCPSATFEINGEFVVPELEHGYAVIRRSWKRGDLVHVHLEMPVQRIYAHPGVIANTGRVALKRGPLVYCLEEADNEGGRVQRFRLERGAKISVVERPNMFGGIVALTASARAVREQGFDGLYGTEPLPQEPSSFTAIPYHLWANRSPGTMLVWIPEAL